MASSIIDTVSSQIETVEKNLQKYFESSDQIAGLIKAAADAVTVSRYLYRIPFQQWRGGVLRKLQYNEGDMGAGTGMKLNSLTAGYIVTNRVFRIGTEQKETSGDSKQSTVDVFQKTLAEAMLEAQIDDDVALSTDGTGKLTNSASASSATTLTFAAVTDSMGVNRLREGTSVDVWDTTGATKRIGGPYQIINIDYTNKIVTFGSAVTGIAATDLLAIANLDVYGPAALTSFSSTWPGGGLSNNAGLTGDSYRHGYLYSNDATGSNYYLGKLKSTISQLIPTRVNAANSSLVFQYGLQGLDGIRQRRDKDAVKGLIGIAHMAQRSQAFIIGTAISNKFIQGTSFGKSLDIMPDNKQYEDTFDFCGITCHVSKRQDRSRFDFINPSVWGRAQLHETKFYDAGDGRKIYPVRAATGNLVTAMETHIVQAYDFVNRDPGASFYIDSLTVPSGY